MEKVKVAAVQAAPVFLDRDATVERAAEWLAKAMVEEPSLVVFPEGFVPGYPEWIWRTKPWDSDFAALYARLLDQAVDVPSATTDAIGDLAREHGVYLVVGVNERARDGGTVYCSLLYFDPTGALVNKHRKLMPTGPERLVWGQGPGTDLSVVQTPFGRIGGLICWENYMPLARVALYEQGLDIYLAPTWDNSDSWVASMRHIAKEGRCYVIGVNHSIRASDVPASIPAYDSVYANDDSWMARGNACIVAPGGELLAGPLIGEEGILFADVDADAARATRYQFDAVGHYSRPDVFGTVGEPLG